MLVHNADAVQRDPISAMLAKATGDRNVLSLRNDTLCQALRLIADVVEVGLGRRRPWWTGAPWEKPREDDDLVVPPLAGQEGRHEHQEEVNPAGPAGRLGQDGDEGGRGANGVG